jgi:uncharacterized protein YukE
MPQAIVDPEELERFARSLKQFNAELGQRMSHLQSQFASLGDTWRDQEQAKFAQEFQQTVKVLHQFKQSADAQIPFLMKKAQRIREYLQQR